MINRRLYGFLAHIGPKWVVFRIFITATSHDYLILCVSLRQPTWCFDVWARLGGLYDFFLVLFLRNYCIFWRCPVSFASFGYGAHLVHNLKYQEAVQDHLTAAEVGDHDHIPGSLRPILFIHRPVLQVTLEPYDDHTVAHYDLEDTEHE